MRDPFSTVISYSPGFRLRSPAFPSHSGVLPNPSWAHAPGSSTGTTLRLMNASPFFALAASSACNCSCCCFAWAAACWPAAIYFAVSPVAPDFWPLGQGRRYFPASFTFITIVCPSSAIFIRKFPL